MLLLSEMPSVRLILASSCSARRWPKSTRMFTGVVEISKNDALLALLSRCRTSSQVDCPALFINRIARALPSFIAPFISAIGDTELKFPNPELKFAHRLPLHQLTCQGCSKDVLQPRRSNVSLFLRAIAVLEAIVSYLPAVIVQLRQSRDHRVAEHHSMLLVSKKAENQGCIRRERAS
ncbi:hypothetical protein BD309DRAFT_371927 [Dichomitus squalens]|uniref:Uncharacterized protein n=1 Tax=Dichomitus squalens TaxID=114155 RepID=A0A4Q9PXW9_9APHY|nr:hypothetical protein BD309DRAFT_371927 [Dichomitus squalens]TBU59376.1 hypothetical protein BD310DRAFT_412664 [Dichomitus squalens]